MRALVSVQVCALAFIAVAACNRNPTANEPRVARNDWDADHTPSRVPSDDEQRVRGDDSTTPKAKPALRPASRVSSATESIARARCAREQRCENIGADEKYASSSDCLTDIRNEWKDDLTARECPGGIDQEDLQECLTEIKNEDCGNPFDTLERVSACTVGQICDTNPDD